MKQHTDMYDKITASEEGHAVRKMTIVFSVLNCNFQLQVEARFWLYNKLCAKFLHGDLTKQQE